MRSRILSIALILALTLSATALAETPLGILPGLNWEDSPETAMACFGNSATLSSSGDSLQSIDVMISDPYGIDAGIATLNLVYSGEELNMGTLVVNGDDPQPYIDALTALYGTPKLLEENEYCAADTLAGLTVKTACVWMVGENRCVYLSEATEQSENPDLLLILYAVLETDEVIED